LDEACPDEFLKEARRWLLRWASEFPAKAGAETAPRLLKLRDEPKVLDDPMAVRQGLLDFIADFANWDLSNDKDFLAMSRALVQCAHECFGGAPGTRPLVIDPFAGGGAIPLETLRVGADAFASDLNPVAVLLNKVVLEYIPKYGRRLADEVRKWGEWVKKEAEKELAVFHPKDPDGSQPIAYLWARTIRCEGPGCGAEVPLLRTALVAKRPKGSIGLRFIADTSRKAVGLELATGVREKDFSEGTVRRGSATCPVCNFTTHVDRVRAQLRKRQGGSADGRLLCVVLAKADHSGRTYRLATPRDEELANLAAKELERRKGDQGGPLSLVPDEMLDVRGIRHTWAMLYGGEKWGDYFHPRQALSLTTLARLVARARTLLESEVGGDLAIAISTCLALAVDRQADSLSALTTWSVGGEFQRNTFARQALPMVWDFAEINPWSDSSGNWLGAIAWIALVCEAGAIPWPSTGSVHMASAAEHPLPDDAANALVTDPPYYDAVPYAFLSDFFYVWLRRSLRGEFPDLFGRDTVPKDEEIVVDRKHELSNSTHDVAFYERQLTAAFAEGRRVVRPDGVGTIVFASKTTASWEALLDAVVKGGWIVTASWPVDTEREARVSAQGQARLGSSVHLVCRPRENPDGSLRTDAVGDWRDVLGELPKRIHEWMPRLKNEGIVGADAIFSCLGPALEIFSRYSRVEMASGQRVELKEYLEHVWAAVAREALAAIFSGADTGTFEEDARLTAMWLWTVAGAEPVPATAPESIEDDGENEPEEGAAESKAANGFLLEYDAARKIAQGLGAHLETLTSVVEVKGPKARLLSVGERASALFGEVESGTVTSTKAKNRKAQLTLGFIGEIEAAEERAGGPGGKLIARVAATVLDRVHQAMILFGAGRGEALRRFLVDDAAGKDERFWRLAQALNQLYPTGTDERRWVEGVMARKKGLGL
jgi:adenine-specific DNA methylase